MRLGTLSLACTSDFMREVHSQGLVTLRIKYPIADIAECVSLAKNLGTLIGHSELEPITVDILRKGEAKITQWIAGGDFLHIAAYAIAAQNSGMMIRGSSEAFIAQTFQNKLRPKAKNVDYYNKYIYEYLWRAVGQYNKNRVKLLEQPGPIDHFIQAYLDEGGGVSARDKVNCFANLNHAAGFLRYSSENEVMLAANRCPVFGSAWERRLAQR